MLFRNILIFCALLQSASHIWCMQSDTAIIPGAAYFTRNSYACPGYQLKYVTFFRYNGDPLCDIYFNKKLYSDSWEFDEKMKDLLDQNTQKPLAFSCSLAKHWPPKCPCRPIAIFRDKSGNILERHNFNIQTQKFALYYSCSKNLTELKNYSSYPLDLSKIDSIEKTPDFNLKKIICHRMETAQLRK